MNTIPPAQFSGGDSMDETSTMISDGRPVSLDLTFDFASPQTETTAVTPSYEVKAPLLSTPPQSKNHRYVNWGVSWYQPTWMVMFLINGAFLATAHHIYYSALEGTIVSTPARQQWAFRFGTAFAYLTQSCLKASVIIACTQCIWAEVRKTTFTVDELDKLFAITTDPRSFCSWRLARGASNVMLLASLVW